MTIGEAVHISDRAAALREAFDRSFVEPQHCDAVATEDFLAIRVGGDPHMLRLAEIAGFYSDRKITGLPSRAAALAGIAGFRGTMLPVYDLAVLLKYAPSQSARWMAIAAEAPLALTFDSFEGHFRFRSDVVAERDGVDTEGHLRRVVRTEDYVRPVIDIPSIVAAICGGTPVAGKTEEH
jgi:purine-binding chemotaxis protein CheW